MRSRKAATGRAGNAFGSRSGLTNTAGPDSGYAAQIAPQVEGQTRRPRNPASGSGKSSMAGVGTPRSARAWRTAPLPPTTSEDGSTATAPSRSAGHS